ncbi:hypothetical protein Bbelb_220030 [Branchiostoma belcheri]|nr:hypothetical protein Bbelb_220030 [Branchiostoma belcheri]
MAILQNSCCCCSVRLGALIIGVLYVIIHIIDLGVKSSSVALGWNAVEKCTAMHTTLLSQMDRFFPLKVVRLHHQDKPWITPDIKALIRQRQQALTRDPNVWKHLRNKTQRMIKVAKEEHYNSRVKSLKKENIAQWHKEIKSMANMSRTEPVIHIEGMDPGNKLGIANEINKSLASVIQSLPPIDLSSLPAYLPSLPAPSVEPWEVYKKLQGVKTRKAAGPDGIPGKLIKEFAYELSSPLADILNSSLQHGILPEEWKCATVVPIPKTKPPSVHELRPISLTSLLAKVAESFVTHWTLSDIRTQIDTQQYGCLKGRSTTHCLLELTNEIFKATDNPGTICSLVATDYSKAFDRVCHTTAIRRLLDLGLRPSLARWIANFLSNRRQSVRYHGTLSDSVTVTCGLPQGTLLGPLIFIAYINGAARHAVCKRWKFVDDLNLLEVRHPISAPSNIQKDLTDLENWSNDSHMRLHPAKCKVLHILFSKVPYVAPPLSVNGIELQQVQGMKILGVFLQANLRWNSHVDSICCKSSQRLFLLRKLKHFHISSEDLVTVYVSYIRPVLEYAAPVWHSGLTTELSNKIEKIQRRAVRIIMGTKYTSYTEGCSYLGLPTLQSRRLLLTVNFANSLRQSEQFRHFLPPVRSAISGRQTRSAYKLNTPRSRTDPYGTDVASVVVDVIAIILGLLLIVAVLGAEKSFWLGPVIGAWIIYYFIFYITIYGVLVVYSHYQNLRDGVDE